MFEPITYQNKDPSPEFDDDRKKEADKFYELHLDCQILAEWFTALAENPPPWYPAEAQLNDWSTKERLDEAADRPDLRLQYMFEGITANIPAVAFRDMPPALQADLLDRIRRSGAKMAVDQIRMFDASSLMVHTDRAKRYDQLVARIDWKDDSPPTKAFIAMVLQSSMHIERQYTEESGRITFHKPPLTYLGLLESIPMKDYLEAIGQDKVIAIFMALRKHQSHDKCLPPDEEIGIVSIEWLCEKLPTSSFLPVFKTVRNTLGFPELKKPEPAKTEEAKLDEPLAVGWQAPAAGESKPGEGDSPKGL